MHTNSLSSKTSFPKVSSALPPFLTASNEAANPKQRVIKKSDASLIKNLGRWLRTYPGYYGNQAHCKCHMKSTNHIGTRFLGKRSSAAVGPLSSSSIGDSFFDTFALNATFY